jgi:hypothetical protein
MKMKNLTKIAIGTVIALEFAFWGCVANDTIQFNKADKVAKESANQLYIASNGRPITMTQSRREMYNKMQKAYQESMGKRYSEFRDPYIQYSNERGEK